VLDILCTRW